ncbi:hypothetical protein KSS87_010540 [Heliosperma pusillum]|nr:hypothetical protein KSS87_010540 [Heliosperma pusillum]
MGENASCVDMISGLPDFVLHQILSLLPTKVAAQTCILCKRWCHIWETFPMLDCCQLFFGKYLDILNPKELGLTKDVRRNIFYQRVEFMRYIDEKLRHISENDRCVKKFRLVMTLVSVGLFPRVDFWMDLVSGLNVRELDLCLTLGRERFYHLPTRVLASQSLTILSMKGCILIDCSSMGDLNLSSLVELYLNGSFIDEESILNLVLSMKSLEVLSLKGCLGFKKLEMNGNKKLKKFVYHPHMNLSIKRLSINLPNLEEFDFVYSRRAKKRLAFTSDIVSPNLKRLSLCGTFIDAKYLSEIFVSFPRLEHLFLGETVVKEAVKLSSSILKEVYLRNCSNTEKAEFDTPGLQVFKYHSKSMSHLSLNSGSGNRIAELPVPSSDMDRSWFTELNNFLRNNRFQELILSITSAQAMPRGGRPPKLQAAARPPKASEASAEDTNLVEASLNRTPRSANLGDFLQLGSSKLGQLQASQPTQSKDSSLASGSGLISSSPSLPKEKSPVIPVVPKIAVVKPVVSTQQDEEGFVSVQVKSKSAPHIEPLVTTLENKVAQGWLSDFSGGRIFSLFCKLRATKHHLKSLHQAEFSGLTARVKLAKENLSSCQLLLQSSPLCALLLQQEKDCLQVYSKLKKAEIKVLAQQAKVHHLKLSDSNTNYFYAHIKARKVRNTIGVIEDMNGHVCHGHSAVANAFVCYYKELLASGTSVTPLPYLGRSSDASLFLLEDNYRSQFYDLVRPRGAFFYQHRTIWDSSCYPKHCVIGLMATQNCLPTIDNLCHRGIVLVNRCVLCEQSMETNFQLVPGSQLGKELDKAAAKMCFDVYYLSPLGNEIAFTTENLNRKQLPRPFVLTSMKLVIYAFTSGKYADLLDGLFENLHPKTLILELNYNSPIHVKGLLNSLAVGPEPNCCRTENLKCWRHLLKGIKLANVRGFQAGTPLDLCTLTSLNDFLDNWAIEACQLLNSFETVVVETLSLDFSW